MALDAVDITIIGRQKKCDQNAVDKCAKRETGGLASVLWKIFVLAFLTSVSDETTDVEERGTAVVFVVLPGSLPQKPDRQPSGCTQNDHAGNGKSDDVKDSIGRNGSGSRKDVD